MAQYNPERERSLYPDPSLDNTSSRDTSFDNTSSQNFSRGDLSRRQDSSRNENTSRGFSFSNMNSSDYFPLLGGGALLLFGLSRQSLRGLLMAALGGGLVYRQLQKQDVLPFQSMTTTLSSDGQSRQLVELEETIVVHQPITDVFDFWSDFQNFPRFMDHIKSVQKLDDKLSHWEAFIPFTDQTISWDAEIIETRSNELIRWRSIADSDIYNEGTVRFKRLPNDAGTQVHARICYRPPAGMIGKIAAQFLNNIPQNFVRSDMERFRRLIENNFPQSGVIDNDISF